MHLGFQLTSPLRTTQKWIAAFLFIALIITSATSANAAEVSQIKGSSVKIDNADTERLAINQKYFIVVAGKKVAVVQITKVAGNQAIGKIIKGDPNKVLVGAIVTANGAKSGARSTAKRGAPKSPLDELTIGGLLGYTMNSQSVKPTSGSAFSMSGSGISLNAFGDVPVSGGLGLIARGGFEQFSVTGSNASGSANAKVTYLDASLLLRYTFLDGGIKPYVAGGLGIFFPMSKSSTNALDVSKISLTTLFLIDAGVNYYISPTLYATGILEYQIFPPSAEVTTTGIALRVGAGFKY